MQERRERVPKTIRMRESVHHLARTAAVMSRRTSGQWIEEAILEKVEREAPQLLQGLVSDAEGG